METHGVEVVGGASRLRLLIVSLFPLPFFKGSVGALLFHPTATFRGDLGVKTNIPCVTSSVKDLDPLTEGRLGRMRPGRQP